jgi:hypothetical protein
MPYDQLGNYYEGSNQDSVTLGPELTSAQIDAMNLELQRNRVPMSPNPTIADLGRVALGFGSAGESLGRGAVASVPGVFGDIEELGREGLNYIGSGRDTNNAIQYDELGNAISNNTGYGESTNMVNPHAALPTTEDILKAVPRVTPKFGDDTSNDFLEGLGGFLSPAMLEKASPYAFKGMQALGETAANKIVAGEPLVPGAGFLNPPVLNVVKPGGGNWIESRLNESANKLKKNPLSGEPLPAASAQKTAAEAKRDEENFMSILRDTGFGEEALTQARNEFALHDWIDKKLKHYVKNQMGTPDDIIRKLAEEGVHHLPLEAEPYVTPNTFNKREKLGFPRYGEAQTPLGKQWEMASDTNLRNMKAGQYQNPDYVEATVIKNNPWLQKLNPETQIYNSDFHRDLGFDHLLDVLREEMTVGNLTAEKLGKVSIEDAIRRADKYDKDAVEAARKRKIHSEEHATVTKKYEDGSKWIKLDQPGQFAAESEAMSHSVKGYEPPNGHEDWVRESGKAGSYSYGHGGWEAIKSGKAEVQSLRDPEGKQIVTVEIKKFPDTNYLPNVTQVKGPSNGVISPSYQDKILDFLNKGEYGDVKGNDLLKNASIMDTHNNSLMKRYINDNYGGDFGIVDPQDTARAYKQAFPKNPRFMDLDEFHDAINSVRPMNEGYKKGGHVKTKVYLAKNVDQMKYELMRSAK